MEEALYVTPMFRGFTWLDMGEENLPDESTIFQFHHLLEKNNLNMQMLATFNAMFTAMGPPLKQGRAVDATRIAAPSSAKTSSYERDPYDLLGLFELFIPVRQPGWEWVDCSA